MPKPPPEKVTLVADSSIRLVNHTECSEMIKDDPTEYANCYSYANLRYSLLKNFERNNPGLLNDVDSYRSRLIHDNLRVANHIGGHPSPDPHVDTIDHRNWTIIGLTQRVKRRRWLNLNETIEYCKNHFLPRRIICVEVNVETLPPANSGNRQGYEQLRLHRSLDALIGVHGAQLTQGVFLPPNATVVELLPWTPKDYFGTGREVWGDWTSTKHQPTPLGIMYHNTDLRHAGYPLGRDSVPLCQNASNEVMHDFSKDPSASDDEHNEVETELEYCLYEIASAEPDIFRWDNRDFVVDTEMIKNFVDVFLPSSGASDVQSCDRLRQRGERKRFVLYNIWCMVKGVGVSLKHYYQNNNKRE